MENLYLLEIHSWERQAEALAQAKRHRLLPYLEQARRPSLRVRLRHLLVALAYHVLQGMNGTFQPAPTLSASGSPVARAKRRPPAGNCPVYRMRERSSLAGRARVRRSSRALKK